MCMMEGEMVTTSIKKMRRRYCPWRKILKELESRKKVRAKRTSESIISH